MQRFQKLVVISFSAMFGIYIRTSKSWYECKINGARKNTGKGTFRMEEQSCLVRFSSTTKQLSVKEPQKSAQVGIVLYCFNIEENPHGIMWSNNTMLWKPRKADYGAVFLVSK